MVPARAGRRRRPPDAADRRLPPALARRRPRILDPVHGPHGPGSRLGRLRRRSRTDRALDVLARDDPAHQLAGPGTGPGRRPVGEARVAPPPHHRERSPGHEVVELLLPLQLARATGHLAGQPDAPRALVLLQGVRTIPGFLEGSVPREPDRCRGAGRGPGRGPDKGVWEEVLEEAAVACSGALKRAA